MSYRGCYILSMQLKLKVYSKIMSFVVKKESLVIPGPSLKTLRKRITEFKSKALCNSTIKARKSQWAFYQIFCNKFSLKPFGFSLDQICLYIVFLAESLCYSSILTYLQALVFKARMSGQYRPDIHHPDVKIILRGVKRAGIHPPKREAMLLSYIVRIFDVLGSKSPLVSQFWTACLLMFRALFCISHIVPSDHTLRWSDVKFKDWGVLIVVRLAKFLLKEGLSIPLACISEERYCVWQYAIG